MASLHITLPHADYNIKYHSGQQKLWKSSVSCGMMNLYEQRGGEGMEKWLFFDLGSTLVDESECERVRIRNTVSGSPVSAEAFDHVFRRFSAQNKNGYACALEYFHLSKAPWPDELEKLYPGVQEMLEDLSRRYALGIIANQKAGLEERLDNFGIRKFFRVIAGSGDVDAVKPDPEIFCFALRQAGCSAVDAVMVGDRLDNDIIPAQQLGMGTVWVRQGYGGLGNPALLEKPCDIIADSVTEIDFDAVFGGAV